MDYGLYKVTPNFLTLNFFTMKLLKLTPCLFIGFVVLTSCEYFDFRGEEIPEASASISGLDGNDVSGTARFVEISGNVQLVLTLENLSPGDHGVHIHTGVCGDTATIGGHWNPTHEPHGQRGVDDEFHRGDIGNIRIGDNGTGTLILSADDWTIGGSDKTNIVGNLVIVHAGADDYTTQPGGDSGPMIGCGTIVEE